MSRKTVLEQGVHLNVAECGHRDLGKERAKRFRWILVCVVRDWLSMFSRNPPATRTSARVCTVSPKKGGALRNQSTGGRRLGVAAALCGALVGAPLLLLQSASAHASRPQAAPGSAHENENEATAAHSTARVDGVRLPS